MSSEKRLSWVRPWTGRLTFATGASGKLETARPRAGVGGV